MKKFDNNHYYQQPGSEFRLWRWLILAFLILTAAFILTPHSSQNIKWENETEFQQLIEDKKIEKVQIQYVAELVGYNIYWTIDNKTYELFVQKGRMENFYANYFPEHEVAVAGKKIMEPSLLNQILPYIILWVAFMLILCLLVFKGLSQIGKPMGTFDKSPAKLFREGKKKITFDDVAGCDEAKEKVRMLVEFLKNPKKFTRLGGKMPKGYALIGPPGSGKTLLAKAIAGEANVPFFSAHGSDFIEMFVGTGASRVRNLFKDAKENAPCIIFIDEAESIGKRDPMFSYGGHSEAEQTTNSLLAELDGFDTKQGIVLIIATNQPSKLDEALIRPGRIDEKIIISRPDINGREAILKVHTRNKILSPELNLKNVAKITPGFTGADLENTANKAALRAAITGKKYIEQEDFESAIDETIVGSKQESKRLGPGEKSIVARHEAGHTLAAELLPHARDIRHVSIIPRGIDSLGHTMQIPEEQEKYLISDDEIKDLISVCFAGRIAEKMKGKITTGSKNDIEIASRLARDFVCKYGMDEIVGPRSFGEDSQSFLGERWIENKNRSEEKSKAIDVAIDELLKECFKKSEEILRENLEILEKISSELEEKETLTRSDIERLIPRELKNKYSHS